MSKKFILALDQGTTSSRAILYDLDGNEVRATSRPVVCRYPKPGWVEQNATEIVKDIIDCAVEAVSGVDKGDISAIGITNQRETTVAFDRKTLEPLAPAIVWQCRRSEEICQRLRPSEAQIREKTGLVCDPYFSASKIIWMLENVPGLQAKAKNGDVVFATIDAWLIAKLSKQREAVTEHSNASRTLLYSLANGSWDEELLSLCGVTEANLPQIRASSGVFCTTEVLGIPVPITGVLGDQQASLLGQRCLERDRAKCTFGTGAFLLANTGTERRQSTQGLLSTVAWKLGESAPLTYAVEGSVFVAGAAIQWLRDEMKFAASAADLDRLAESCADTGGLTVVPAFTGLGAPRWDAKVRGAIFGLTRGSGAKEIVRATYEGICHQVADLFEGDEIAFVDSLNVDGGLCRADIFCQILADALGRQVIRGERLETTAFGAAIAAAVGAGIFSSGEAARKFNGRPLDGVIARVFEPESDFSAKRILWKASVDSLS
jgi:glycerol kinase